MQWHSTGQNGAGHYSFLLKQLPPETGPPSEAQLVWTAHLPTGAHRHVVPWGSTGVCHASRMDRRSDWPSQAGLQPEMVSFPLVWTVLWVQVVPREGIRLGRENSMSDLGQVGRRVHGTCCGVDPFPMCFGSEQALMAQRSLCQGHSQLESMRRRLAFKSWLCLHRFHHQVFHDQLLCGSLS